MKLFSLRKFAHFTLGVIFTILSFMIFYFVAKPLFPDNVTEVDKRLHFDYSVNRATEYDEMEQPFWWLEMGENSILLANIGDETIIGTVRLAMTPNPCNYYRTIEINYLDKKDKIIFLANQEILHYELEVKLEPFENKILGFNSITGMDCRVNNGDQRNFLLKLIEVGFN